MFEQDINIAKFALGYGDMLLADIDAAHFAHQPVPGMNTPAWIIGHLAFVADRVAGRLGAEPQLAHWEALFGLGSSPGAGDGCPGKEELVAAWKAAQQRLFDAIAAAPADAFEGENPIERMKAVAPSMKDFITFVLTAHPALHLGQLSSWRRACGKPALF